MRKINDSELVTLLDSGKSQTECAVHFGVSPSAITQRVQKIKLQTPSEAFLRLTEKERSFVLLKAGGSNNLQAVKGSFDVTSDESAKSIGTQLMQKDDVRQSLSSIMEQSGIGRLRRIQRLRDMIECKDFTAVGKGLDMSWKLDGSYSPEKLDISVVYDAAGREAHIAELRRMLAEVMALPDAADVVDVSSD